MQILVQCRRWPYLRGVDGRCNFVGQDFLENFLDGMLEKVSGPCFDILYLMGGCMVE